MVEQTQVEKIVKKKGAILVPGAGYMCLIFECLSFEENMKIMQQLAIQESVLPACALNLQDGVPDTFHSRS